MPMDEMLRHTGTELSACGNRAEVLLRQQVSPLWDVDLPRLGSVSDGAR